jgi:uncharacterized protein
VIKAMEFAGEMTDPVHRYIRFSQVEKEVIDNPAFQRLRRIRQLAGAHSLPERPTFAL